MAEIISLHDAVKQFVNDGDTVALEGFTHLIPTAGRYLEAKTAAAYAQEPGEA